MDPRTTKRISARSCLRHANRELAAANAASDIWRQALLMNDYDAWMSRYRLALWLEDEGGKPLATL